MLSRAGVIASLQERLRQVVAPTDQGQSSSGAAEIDRLLPAGGFRRGTLVEWLRDEGSGGSALAAVAAREATSDGRAVVVVDPLRRFYPPGLARLGIDLEKVIVVCPSNASDHSWVLNQSLRCRGVGAVLCWLGKLEGKAYRRLQLAAEAGGTLGLLVRDARLQSDPSWADVRLLVRSLPYEKAVPPEKASDDAAFRRRLLVELLRCRGGSGGRSVQVELDSEGRIHATHSVPVAPQLAPAASYGRSTGA